MIIFWGDIYDVCWGGNWSVLVGEGRGVGFRKGSTIEIHAAGIWASPVRGGGQGLNPCPDDLGHFFREEFAKIKWAFA